VEVRSGREAGRALEADDLALDHAVADRDHQRVQVAVERLDPVPMGDHDVVAIADPAGRGGNHDAVAGCLHRRAGGVGEVEPGMEMGVRPERWLEDQ